MQKILYERQADPQTLVQDFVNAGLWGALVLNVEMHGTSEIVVSTPDGLIQNQIDQITAVIEAHALPNPMVGMVAQKVNAAMEFGKSLMASYGASNILAGMSVTQIQDIMSKTQTLQNALGSGSLYVAIDEINKLPVDGVLITTDRVTMFRNKIQDYLGIPRT